MGELVFRCPKTAREIATGMGVSRTRLARSRRRIMYLDCPHCQETHGLRIAEGWIGDHLAAVPPPSAPAGRPATA